MRKKLVAPLAVVGSFLALGAAGVSSVGALSCAAHPDGSPEAIASGTERLSTEDDFFDRYDYAVIGTVTEIHTVEAGEPNYGATTLSLDVVAVLGEGPADPRIEISSPDPGWMAGYRYEAGVAYLIPVQSRGPEGQPNYSFLCDPITEVDLEIASTLRRLAADAGIPFSTPDVAPAPAPADESDHDEELAAAGTASSSGLPVAAIALCVGVAATAGATALRRAKELGPRRRSCRPDVPIWGAPLAPRARR